MSKLIFDKILTRSIFTTLPSLHYHHGPSLSTMRRFYFSLSCTTSRKHPHSQMHWRCGTSDFRKMVYHSRKDYSTSSSPSGLLSPMTSLQSLTKSIPLLRQSCQLSSFSQIRSLNDKISTVQPISSSLYRNSTVNMNSLVTHGSLHQGFHCNNNKTTHTCQRLDIHTHSSSSLSSSISSSPNYCKSSSKSHEGTSFEITATDSLILRHGSETRTLPFMWLRDHCRCQSCYNYETSQKKNAKSPLEQQLCVSEVYLENNTTLVIDWKDGHRTSYTVDWLMENFYRERSNPSVERVLWDSDIIQTRGLPSVSFTSHVDTEDGLRQTLRNLLQFGFSFIEGAPVSLADTQRATERVSPVLHTLFGGMWEFTSDGLHSDTAYNTESLASHTDNTYLETPAGIQVFHCLEHNGQGGETLLVDGFHAVERLRQSHPEAVRCLSRHLIPHEYKEPPLDSGSPGYHMYTLSPVIRLHPATGEIIHLRFNPYDRAPLNTIPPQDMAEFYRSYQLLSDVIADTKGQFWVKLKPGNIVLIDNWRVMHGRSSFDGKRDMCGCYLPRDEWMSKVRMMGLEPSG